MSPRAQELAKVTGPDAAKRPGGKRKGAGRPVPSPGGTRDQGVRAKNQRSCTNVEKPRGETSEYLAARIARDAPAIHQAMKAGKYPSVRAAAQAAGIVKSRDPVRAAARAFAKVPTERLAELVALLPKNTKRQLREALRDEGGST